MKRIGLIGWFLFVIVLSAVLGNRSALAQGCNTSCGCACQNNPRSKFGYYICTTPCSWCGGGADGGCETDYCNGTCGSLPYVWRFSDVSERKLRMNHWNARSTRVTAREAAGWFECDIEFHGCLLLRERIVASVSSLAG
jgi:hypothetical protein